MKLSKDQYIPYFLVSNFNIRVRLPFGIGRFRAVLAPLPSSFWFPQFQCPFLSGMTSIYMSFTTFSSAILVNFLYPCRISTGLELEMHAVKTFQTGRKLYIKFEVCK